MQYVENATVKIVMLRPRTAINLIQTRRNSAMLAAKVNVNSRRWLCVGHTARQPQTVCQRTLGAWATRIEPFNKNSSLLVLFRDLEEFTMLVPLTFIVFGRPFAVSLSPTG